MEVVTEFIGVLLTSLFSFQLYYVICMSPLVPDSPIYIFCYCVINRGLPYCLSNVSNCHFLSVLIWRRPKSCKCGDLCDRGQLATTGCKEKNVYSPTVGWGDGWIWVHRAIQCCTKNLFAVALGTSSCHTYLACKIWTSAITCPLLSEQKMQKEQMRNWELLPSWWKWYRLSAWVRYSF